MRVVYGINPVLEALKSERETVGRVLASTGRGGRPLEEIMKAARGRGIPVERAADAELDNLTSTRNHQGVVAVLYGEFKYSDIEDLIAFWKGKGGPALFLILDSIQDPQNLGSLIRAANAAGAHGVIIPRDRACEVTPAVAKASAGAVEHTLIARETNIVRAVERLKEANVWVAGIEADGRETIYKADLKGDIAIAVGSEGKGLRRLVRESCDFCLSIPMAGSINSLNAAQAGAIALFEARRQRL